MGRACLTHNSDVKCVQSFAEDHEGVRPLESPSHGYSKICATAIFVISDSISHCMFMAYLHTKFHVRNSNGSLVTAIQLKVKCTFHAAAMLFHSLLVQKLPKKPPYFVNT